MTSAQSEAGELCVLQSRRNGVSNVSDIRLVVGGGVAEKPDEQMVALLRDAHASPAPRAAVKAGTRLVREWNGETHTVLVHADGVEWRGQRYRSLSVVAREITGAHWSGPRFFGLTSTKGAGDG